MIRAAVIALPLVVSEPQAIEPRQPVRSGIYPGFWVRLLSGMGDA